MKRKNELSPKDLRDICDPSLFKFETTKELLDPSVFILQPEVQVLMEDNEYLKTICPHEFVNGVCTICGKVE